jgi:hypothetical protein
MVGPRVRLTIARGTGWARTLNAIRGHPNALVDLNVMSRGKFHTTRRSLPSDFRAICDSPDSDPCEKRNQVTRRISLFPVRPNFRPT